MRGTRPSGSEGGATELNQSFLPLSLDDRPTWRRRIMPGESLAGQAADSVPSASTSGKKPGFSEKAGLFMTAYFSPISSLTFGSIASAQVV